MAITGTGAYFLLRLKQRSYPDRTFSLMDIGEQNWFETTTLVEVLDMAKQMGVRVSAEADQAVRRAQQDQVNAFKKARVFYYNVMGVADYDAIDLHGTPFAKKINLNSPFEPDRQFDVVLNYGTTEHVFNQFEVFNSIHKLCAVGGFMVHGLPLSGGREHGFFNYHATTFFDLAAANGYVVADIMWSELKKKGDQMVSAIRTFDASVDMLKHIDHQPLGEESISICFQKMTDQPFRCPMQGYYDSESGGDEVAFLRDFWKRHR